MTLTKRAIALVIAVVLAFALCIPAFAHDAPDPSKPCTINITMKTADGTHVGGGKLSAYLVGNVAESDGDYNFELSDDFAKSGLVLDDIGSAKLAKDMADYASKNSLKPIVTKGVSEKGEISFTDLQMGLYLMMQNEPAVGYNKVDAFLVSVPVAVDGTYVYTVDASPKVEVERAPETKPTETKPPVIPSTGQLNWPIPVLVICGLSFVCIGMALKFRKKHTNEQ